MKSKAEYRERREIAELAGYYSWRNLLPHERWGYEVAGITCSAYIKKYSYRVRWYRRFMYRLKKHGIVIGGKRFSKGEWMNRQNGYTYFDDRELYEKYLKDYDLDKKE